MTDVHPGRSDALAALTLALAFSLAGCASGPNFQRPAPPAVATYTATRSPIQTDSSPGPVGGAQRLVGGLTVSTNWWRALGSPALDALIEQAFEASPTLAAAEATLRQAQELLAARAGSTRYPQADLSAGTQHTRMNPASLGQVGEPREFSLLTATVGVRYNLDLAGGSRRALEALAARANFQRYQVEGARLALSAAIATAAVRQGEQAAQLETASAILQLQDEELGVARARLRLGAASPDEVLAMESRVAQSRAAVLLRQSLLQQNEHLLAMLAGRAPGAGRLPAFSLSALTLPADLPLVVPSELVRMRPDIQAAEALMRAANAEYGVAVARSYPQLNLSAALGSQGVSAATLFGSGSVVWNLISQVTQPLLNPGLPAERRAALAAFEAATAYYEGVVLASLRTMADVLVALDHNSKALAERARAERAAMGALESVQRQYALGAAGYREVLAAQQQAQLTHIDLVAAQAQRLVDTVALYQALGGGGALPPD